MDYKFFDEKIIDFNPHDIIKAYDNGYIFTRKQKGIVQKVRSIRVNLSNFYESSENKRILKKYQHRILIKEINKNTYNAETLLIAKKFYDTKFGKETFSSYKLKEILIGENNFNVIITFENENNIDGYCICLSIENLIIHYAYPFYKLNFINTNFGMYMMTLTIKEFKKRGFSYIYLGSCHDIKCKYKLQFKGLEWFDEQNNLWSNDIQKLKSIINKTNNY